MSANDSRLWASLDSISRIIPHSQPSDLSDIHRSCDVHEEDWTFFREALPEYEVRERIQYGGQGVVYKATDRVAKRSVAIKVLLHGPLASDRQRQRLLREMELAARLRHPNIVTMYRAGEVRGRPFIVMQYIDGMPIDEFVLLNDLSVRQIVSKFTTVCRAVGSAHEFGVLHRDIKPSNVLVDNEGRPYLLDFGLARDLDRRDDGEAVTLSGIGQVVGTLAYLSPERCIGTNDTVDIRSDIYSLGVVLFELITGCLPYPIDESFDEVRSNIVSRQPLSLRKALGRNTLDRPGALGDLNDDLERVVKKAMAKEGQRRYHTAISFADDLDRYLTGEAVEAKSDSALYVLRKTVRRFRLPLAVVAFVTVGVIVAGAMIAAEQIRTKAVREVAQRGLQMGGLVRLGSARAGEGEIDQAVALFEAAIEIGKVAPRQDYASLRYHRDALHRLAVIYLDRGQLDKAQPYVNSAIRLARDAVRADPDNLDWRRMLGFSQWLKGRWEYERQDWNQALAALERAASIRSDLLSSDPSNVSLKSDLATTRALVGQCYAKLDNFRSAQAEYLAAHELYTELIILEPGDVERVTEMCRTEARIGRLYLTPNTPESDTMAAKWLGSADLRLRSLPSYAEFQPVRDLLANISTNQEVIEKRAAWRARHRD